MKICHSPPNFVFSYDIDVDKLGQKINKILQTIYM